MLMANARLSRESVNGYRRFSRLIAPALAGVDRILAQGSKDARRFIECGARQDCVERAGNLKFDIELSPTLWETGELLRAGWGVNRPVLVAGSTHEDDERVLLPAFRQVLERHPQALLVLAPRHPERFARAAQDVAAAGLSFRRRSEGRFPGDAQCLVLDTLGELLSYYAAADVTFVGGTIADIGGHNLLEPAALGKPLLFGPHTANVRETATRLLASGAAHRVLTVEDMRAELVRLFDHPATRDRMGQAGLSLVQKGRGALAKTMTALDQVGRAPSS
jgi:3-deoxy-D-manno-octulosonic-acid transferase